MWSTGLEFMFETKCWRCLKVEVPEEGFGLCDQCLEELRDQVDA